MAAYFWPGVGIQPSIDTDRRSQRKDRATQIAVLWPVRNGRTAGTRGGRGRGRINPVADHYSAWRIGCPRHPVPVFFQWNAAE
jgi:hypothetical protein